MSTAGPHAVSCPNCQTALTPAMHFCPTCGQETHSLNMPLGHLLYEVIEGFLHFDSKFLNTARVLLTRPGKITSDFIVGRRARYVPPVRLYFFVSFVFFLLLSMVSEKSLKQNEQYRQQAQARQQALQQQVHRGFGQLGLVPAAVLPAQWHEQLPVGQQQQLLRRMQAWLSQKTADTLLPRRTAPAYLRRQYAVLWAQVQRQDSTLSNRPVAVGLSYSGRPTKTAMPLTLVLPRRVFQTSAAASAATLDSTLLAYGQPATWYHRALLRQTARIMVRGDRQTTFERFRQLVHRVVKNTSLMMFVLMPVVALLLLLIYRRQHRFYYEHFIFSVHLHTVLFLLLSVVLCLWLWAGSGAVGFLVVLAFTLVYFGLALKKVYQQSWLQTAGRFLLFLLGYVGCFSLLLLLTGAYSFLTY